MASQRPFAALGVNQPLSFEPQGVPRSPGPTTMLWSPEDGSREVDMSKDSFDRACFCFGGMASPGMPGCKSGRLPCTPGSAQSRACGVKRSHDVPVSPNKVPDDSAKLIKTLVKLLKILKKIRVYKK